MTAVATDELLFRFPDRNAALADVRLVADLMKRQPPRSFHRRADGWELRLERPPNVARMEYELELVRRDGTTERVPDSANPLRAPGPFGDKSVVELPEYERPEWLDDVDAPAGTLRRLRLPSRRLHATVRGLLWVAPGVKRGAELPLLVAHDGPEYAQLSQLVRLLEVGVAENELPPLRAALLAPVERNETYSASRRYAGALARELLPQLSRIAPTRPGRRYVAGMGASLGALAMLHAHRNHPESFGALFLQSGSFFRRRLDRHEHGFRRYRRIVGFVDGVVATPAWADPVPVTVTCGTGEENLANNRVMADALAAQGYPVDLVEHADAHNWVSWRDVFDPYLLNLLQRAWV